ncbi:MAG: fructosamine kinase family protein [Leptospiraceae bacterium]|nr:fructosamine kinase family protein [Leptospiraceae bacterium]MDW8307169.1 fructosamine kinase family protein [Leptospiraceae bacterium]
MSFWQEKIENLTGKIYKSYPLAGGDINEVEYLKSERGEFVLKKNKHMPKDFFPCEAKNLLFLKERKLPVPEVVGYGEGYLLLRYYPPGEKNYGLAGEMLALLHQNSSQKCGLDFDNYIGSLPQKNTYESSWPLFYRNHRILPMLEMIGVMRKEHNDFSLWARLLDKLEIIIGEDYTISALHGDLWGGNLYHSQEGPLFIDPACYYGDHLVDIAMTELFGGFSRDFYASYSTIMSLGERYRSLAKLYQLYPLLVHAKLFGSSYYQQAREIAKRYV